MSTASARASTVVITTIVLRALLLSARRHLSESIISVSLRSGMMAFKELLLERDPENVVVFDTVRSGDNLRDHAHRLTVVFGHALRLLRTGFTESSVHCDGTILGCETTTSVSLSNFRVGCQWLVSLPRRAVQCPTFSVTIGLGVRFIGYLLSALAGRVRRPGHG